MELKRPSRDLQKILGIVRSRGVPAVIDGDAVAVFTVRKQEVADGLRHVHYDVRRLRTLTEAYTAVY